MAGKSKQLILHWPIWVIKARTQWESMMYLINRSISPRLMTYCYRWLGRQPFNRVWLISAPGGEIAAVHCQVAGLTLGHKERREIKCCGSIPYDLILPPARSPLSSGATCPSFYLRVEDLWWFVRALTPSPLSSKSRREAEDDLRVPPGGADEDEDHQFYSRGDDAFAQ